MNHTFLSALFCFSVTVQALASGTITGKIIFSSTLFPLSIYSGGTKALCELDAYTKQLVFTVPRYEGQKDFSVIITEPIIKHEIIDPALSNTIDHLKIPRGQRYKLYHISLGADQKWIVQEKSLDDTLRIPDQAIIICCNPDFVAGLEGITPLELPMIKMYDDLISLVGSESKLHDAINGFVLASIDVDTIHTKTQPSRHLKIAQNKVLIAPPIS